MTMPNSGNMSHQKSRNSSSVIRVLPARAPSDPYSPLRGVLDAGLAGDGFRQIGQALCGLRLGGCPGGGGADGEAVRIGQPALQSGCERRGFEFLLGEEIGGADGGEAFGVGGLMIVRRGGERNE